MTMRKTEEISRNPEIPRKLDITKAIRANNSVWNRTYYDQLVSTNGYQLCITPSLQQDAYLNSAQAVRISSLPALEQALSDHNLKPAIYVDPLTPSALVSKLPENGYVKYDAATDNDQTEVWRIFDLSGPLPDASNMLKISSDRVSYEISTPSEDRKALEDFLMVDQQTNDLDEATISQLRKNLINKSGDDTEIHILRSFVDGQLAGVICLGANDNMGFLSEGGTLAEFRGLGLFPWMRVICLEIAEEKGYSYVMSNTLESNTTSHKGSDKTGFERGFKRELWIKEG